jgi:hypothetical protein
MKQRGGGTGTPVHAVMQPSSLIKHPHGSPPRLRHAE